MQKINAKDLTSKSAVAFVKMFERTYGDWKDIASRSFVSGIFTGLGATVGVAFVVVVLGFVLEKLGVIPVIGDFFKQLDLFLKSAMPR